MVGEWTVVSKRIRKWMLSTKSNQSLSNASSVILRWEPWERLRDSQSPNVRHANTCDLGAWLQFTGTRTLEGWIQLKATCLPLCLKKGGHKFRTSPVHYYPSQNATNSRHTGKYLPCCHLPNKSKKEVICRNGLTSIPHPEQSNHQ